MAPSDKGHEVLSSLYGEDVFLVLSSTYVCSSYDRVGSFRFVSGMSLGKLGAKDAYPVGHENDVFSLFSGLVRPEYPKGPSACRHLHQSVLES